MRIELIDVSYKKNLKNINISLSNNYINCIVGENGSGKSLLLDIICKKIKNSNGVIKYSKGTISYLEQNSKYNNNCKNVYTELKKVLEKNSVLMDNLDRYILNAIKKFNLEKGVLEKKYNELSFIDYRKIKLIELLLSNTDCIVLDEPTLGFNELEKKQFVKMIKQMKRKYLKMFIISTTDMELVNIINEYIFILNKGKVFTHGKYYDVFANYISLKSDIIDLPLIVQFNKMFYDKKNIKLLLRNDINDLLKDLYRLKW